MSPRAVADGSLARPDGRPVPARDRLLDALRLVVSRHGLGGLTVGSICDEAGLSRATFYVHFPTRDDALLALFLEEARTVIDAARTIADSQVGFGELCVEAVVRGLDIIRANAVLRPLFSDEHASVASRMASTSSAFLDMARAYWVPLVVAAQERGEVRPGLDADDVLRWLLRVFLSYLEQGDELSPDELRRELRLFLLPAFLATADRAGDTARLVHRASEQAEQLSATVDELRRQLDRPRRRRAR